MSGKHAARLRGRKQRREQITDYDAETIRVFVEQNLVIQQERAMQFVRQLVMPLVARTRSFKAAITMTGVIRAQVAASARRP